MLQPDIENREAQSAKPDTKRTNGRRRVPNPPTRIRAVPTSTRTISKIPSSQPCVPLTFHRDETSFAPNLAVAADQTRGKNPKRAGRAVGPFSSQLLKNDPRPSLLSERGWSTFERMPRELWDTVVNSGFGLHHDNNLTDQTTKLFARCPKGGRARDHSSSSGRQFFLL